MSVSVCVCAREFYSINPSDCESQQRSESFVTAAIASEFDFVILHNSPVADRMSMGIRVPCNYTLSWVTQMWPCLKRHIFFCIRLVFGTQQMFFHRRPVHSRYSNGLALQRHRPANLCSGCSSLSHYPAPQVVARVVKYLLLSGKRTM